MMSHDGGKRKLGLMVVVVVITVVLVRSGGGRKKGEKRSCNVAQ